MYYRLFTRNIDHPFIVAVKRPFSNNTQSYCFCQTRESRLLHAVSSGNKTPHRVYSVKTAIAYNNNIIIEHLCSLVSYRRGSKTCLRKRVNRQIRLNTYCTYNFCFFIRIFPINYSISNVLYNSFILI